MATKLLGVFVEMFLRCLSPHYPQLKLMGPMRPGWSKNFTDFISLLSLISFLFLHDLLRNASFYKSPNIHDPHCGWGLCVNGFSNHLIYPFSLVSQNFWGGLNNGQKVFSVVSCAGARGKGNINVPIKAHLMPQKPGQAYSQHLNERDNRNDRT